MKFGAIWSPNHQIVCPSGHPPTLKRPSETGRGIRRSRGFQIYASRGTRSPGSIPGPPDDPRSSGATASNVPECRNSGTNETPKAPKRHRKWSKSERKFVPNFEAAPEGHLDQIMDYDGPKEHTGRGYTGVGEPMEGCRGEVPPLFRSKEWRL